FNDGEQDGVGMYQVTQRGGMRASTAVAYLRPASERPNLDVMPYMQVHRILLDGTRAVGVEAAQIGEPEHLAMREIEVALEQPAVGENLGDHPAAQLVWTTPEPESLLLALEPE